MEEYTEPLKLAPIAQNDHCCILVEGKLCQKSKYTKVKRRLITPERKQDLLANLAATDWNEVICAPSVHSKVNIYHQKITELLDRHCPERVVKVRSDRPPWITSSIIKLITARDEAFRRGCLSYKFLRSLVQKAVRASKRRYINDKLNSDQNSKAWWDTVKQITNNKSTKPIAEYTVIDGERLSNEQLSTNLNDFYKSVGGDAVYIDSSTVRSQRAALDPVSIGEVKTLLNQLDITKATSHEDYPTWLSKEGKEDICVPVHDIINSMLNSGQYPDFYKRAQITPLPKVSHPKLYKDFRPVSLLFHIGKLCEQVIVNKLKSSVQTAISSSQFAYRPKLGTTDAILQLIDDCTADLDDPDNKYVQMACLDFSKAFDKLQPNIVLDKMRKCGINESLLDILCSFLERRKQCVRVNSCFSKYIDISVGAPQGTKLGPLLWLFYVNDLEVKGFNTVKYADDTTFYKSFGKQTGTTAPAILNTIEWAQQNRMVLNADKTVILNLMFSSRHSCDDPIFVDDDLSIEPSFSVKFLGTHIDNHMTFSEHVDQIISSCNSRLYLLRQLKILGMNSDGLKRYFCANIRSLISYASPAWFFMLSNHDRDRLEKIQRSATRTILPDFSYEDRLEILCLPTVYNFIFELSKTHFTRIADDPEHPLFSRVIKNFSRTSSRNNTVFRPKKCRTQKRAKSFFPFFMSYFNNLRS